MLGIDLERDGLETTICTILLIKVEQGRIRNVQLPGLKFQKFCQVGKWTFVTLSILIWMKLDGGSC